MKFTLKFIINFVTKFDCLLIDGTLRRLDRSKLSGQDCFIGLRRSELPVVLERRRFPVIYSDEFLKDSLLRDSLKRLLHDVKS